MYFEYPLFVALSDTTIMRQEAMETKLPAHRQRSCSRATKEHLLRIRFPDRRRRYSLLFLWTASLNLEGDDFAGNARILARMAQEEVSGWIRDAGILGGKT